MEARDVPASLWWSGGGADTDFYTTANWSPAQVPHQGDNLLFQWRSPVPSSGKDCTNMGLLPARSVAVEVGDEPPASTPETSLRILGGYDGTVTLSAPQRFDTFELKAPLGAIAQPGNLYPTDITVINKFTWTDGTLNSSGYDSTLTVLGGTADISPNNEGTVTTGSTLVLQAATTIAGTVGSFATFNPGTMVFTNGHGVEVGEFCTADLPKSKVTWSVPQDAPGPYRLLLQGTGTVRNGSGQPASMSTLGMPLVVSGGLLEIKATAGVTFKGNFTVDIFGATIPMGSVVMSSGEIHIMATGTLGAEKGMQMTGGYLTALIPKNTDGTQAGRSGTVDGKLTVRGGSVGINYEPMAVSSVGFLYVTKDVIWEDGDFRPEINLASPEDRGEWRAEGKFTINIDEAEVRPRFANPGVVPAAGATWSVLVGVGGVTGLPQLDVPGYAIEKNPANGSFVRIKKT